MTENKKVLLGLDVGERRIGVAVADSIGRLAAPLVTLDVDGTELVRLQRLMLEHDVDEFVVGQPRNMAGEPTRQTELIWDFVTGRLAAFEYPIHYQDESLTSVQAEEELRQRGKRYDKAAIDAQAAAIILQDYIEAQHGH